MRTWRAPPTYPMKSVREVVRAAHAEGVRGAAHTTTGRAAGLVAAGVDQSSTATP